MKLLDMLEKNLSEKENDNVPVELLKTSKFKNKTAEDNAVKDSSSDYLGLSQKEAEKRLLRQGKNELKSQKKSSATKIFFSQYKDIMTVILLICTAVSIFMGEYVEAISIAVIVLMNGILGFIQEYRTEKTLDALKNMAAPMAKVFRDGIISKIPASNIVVDDVVLLEAGDRIPADGKLVESASLECDESMLTGESVPVKKNADETKSMLYMGCTVTKGHGSFIVTAIGMDTQMGSIASMLQTIEDNSTPLQKKLGQLSKYIAAGCLLICTIVSVTGILRGENILDMLITGVSLAVAAVPEGLTAVVTISLALSVSRMVKRNALVRRLHAVETLGCATIICTDKTGTLTQNRMAATDVCLFSGHHDANKLDTSDKATDLLLKCLSLCNNATIYEDERPPFGEHTDLTLLELSNRYNYTRKNLEKSFYRISEQPFDSTRKRMSVIVKNEFGEKYMFVKGAFDILLDRSKSFQSGNDVIKMMPNHKKQFLSQSDSLADNALRVIGAAYKPITNISPGEKENGLIFLGIIGMIDPPRPEVKDAVFRCNKAGIKTVMITGDHKKTAAAIARKVGILHDEELVLTGSELDKLNVEQLSNIIPKVSVFARVNPNHKLQIVKAMKHKGHIVAMTGDGVNDAPAIKEADIGVSMGISGTDVTKEASEIILLDDNFATLVNAVDEGRSIYQNIRKFIRYLLSCNIGEVLTMFLGMLFGMPIILFPLQILLVNLVTDGLPAIALGLEPSDKRAMSRPPRRPGESVFSNGLATKIVIRGILIGLSTLASFVTLFSITGSVTTARTGALFALIFAQLIHVFECKSEEKGIFHIPFFNNKKLLFATMISLITLIAILYYPPLQTIFMTVPLKLHEVLIPIGYCIIAPIVSNFLHSHFNH